MTPITDGDARRTVVRWAASPAAVQELFVISPETTFVTGPITEAGFVDYRAAIDAETVEGIASETNFEVAFRRLAPPIDHETRVQRRYAITLGLEDNATGSRNFANAIERLGTPPDINGHQHQDAWSLHYEWPDHETNSGEPWFDAELDRLVSASRLPHYYTPFIDLDSGVPLDDAGLNPPDGLALSLAATFQLRPHVRALADRGRRRFETGQFNSAIDDWKACLRLLNCRGIPRSLRHWRRRQAPIMLSGKSFICSKLIPWPVRAMKSSASASG